MSKLTSEQWRRAYNTPIFSSDTYSVMVQSVDGEPTRAVIYVRWRDTYTLFGENARLFVEEYGKLRKNIRDADRSLPDLGGFQYWRWNESVFHPFFAEWVERAKTLNLALQVMDIEHPEVHNM